MADSRCLSAQMAVPKCRVHMWWWCLGVFGECAINRVISNLSSLQAFI